MLNCTPIGYAVFIILQLIAKRTIHPDSTLSLIYFTSTASAAVRVGVGEEEEVLIYPDPTLGTIRVYPTDSFSSSSGPFSKSSTPLVATGTPPTNKNQVIGRPDDPTPRKVPPLFKVPSLPPPAAPPLLSLPVEDDENGRQREVYGCLHAMYKANAKFSMPGNKEKYSGISEVHYRYPITSRVPRIIWLRIQGG